MSYRDRPDWPANANALPGSWGSHITYTGHTATILIPSLSGRTQLGILDNVNIATGTNTALNLLYLLDHGQFWSNLSSIILPQFKYFNCVPLVSCQQDVKEVVANGSLSKAGGFVSTESKPADGGNPLQVRMRMKPFVWEKERRKRMYCSPPLISRGTMGREFGSVLFQIPPFRNPSPFSPAASITETWLRLTTDHLGL